MLKKHKRCHFVHGNANNSLRTPRSQLVYYASHRHRVVYHINYALGLYVHIHFLVEVLILGKKMQQTVSTHVRHMQANNYSSIIRNIGGENVNEQCHAFFSAYDKTGSRFLGG